MAKRSAAQSAASKRNLEKARKAKKSRGGVGNVPNRYSGGKATNVRKAAAAQRRGNYLFANPSTRHKAIHEYKKAEKLLGRRVSK